MKPRDYQQQAIDSVFDYLHRRSGNPLVCAPTGAGKSVILSGLFKEAHASFESVRIMLLTHVKELIQQNHAAFCRMAPDLAWKTGILSAGLGKKQHNAQFLFAGVQSAHKKAKQIGHVDLVIVDECHMIPHNGDGMYRSLLSDLWAINPDIRVIGLTATPYRLNGGMLCQGKGKLFDSVCYDIDVLMLIKRGFLSPLISQNGATEYDTSNVKERGGEFVQSDLAHAIEADDAKTALACEEIVNLGNEQGRKSWLIFASSVKHAEQVQENLAALGEHSEVITGDTDKGKRARIIQQFREGELRCIVNVNVLTTGFDAPATDLVALLRPTKSPGLYCLDAETEILTREGFRRCEDIDAEAEIACPDTASMSCRWAKAEAKLVNPESAQSFVEYESKMLSLKVTDGHNMIWAGRKYGGGYSEWRKSTAEDLLRKKDGFIVPTAVEMDFPGIPLTDDEIAFLGLVATDGTVNKANGAITIYQSSKNSQKPVVDLIERTIEGCGFKFSRHVVGAAKTFGDGFSPMIRWTISKGKPRGRDKHLRGWGELESYIHKTSIPSDIVDGMSSEQFRIYLNAVEAGDGQKQPRNVKWKQNNIHIGIASKTYADDLQRMCILRGMSANISAEDRDGKDFFHVNIKKGMHRTVGGANQKDRPRLSSSVSHEMSWCVQTPTGNIITRRNGKVWVMGNCQMLGRGMRIADGKENALVLDFGGNIDRHGPINDVKMPKPPGRGGQAVVKDCPQCHFEGIPAGKRICPECEYEFPPPEVKVNTRASTAQVIREGVDNGTWLKVKTVWYKRHSKKGKPDSMRVEYWGGMTKLASEWVCIEHTGFAQTKAIQWFDAHLGEDDYVPCDVSEALERREEYKRPSRIRVMESNGYDRIVEFDWEGEVPECLPEPDEPQDDDISFDPVELEKELQQESKANDDSDFYSDDLPF